LINKTALDMGDTQELLFPSSALPVSGQKGIISVHSIRKPLKLFQK